MEAENAALRPNDSALAELCDLVYRAKEELLSEPRYCVAYPDGSGPANWNVPETDAINGDRLKCLSGQGNVYAIFVGECEQWTAKYVGQRKSGKLRERMRQHLVKKSEGTGSQLPKVQRAVADGKKIGISYVLIKPESLRHYVEEVIIATRANGELSWNK